MKIRVLIADDEPLTREIFRDYLSVDPRIEVVGEAANGRVAVQQTAALNPDLVLMDMQMPEADGVEATEAITRAHPKVKILALTTFSTDRYVVDLLRAGASGYLVKDTHPEQILDAIHSTMSGDSVIDPSVLRHVVDGLESSVPRQIGPDPQVSGLLTDKELEVVELLAEGLSNKEMAARLFVSESTIKSRFVKIMQKLHARDRVQILITAVTKGLVTLED